MRFGASVSVRENRRAEWGFDAQRVAEGRAVGASQPPKGANSSGGLDTVVVVLTCFIVIERN